MGPAETPDFDAFWNFADPAKTESEFLRLLEHVAMPADSSRLAELLSQLARAQGFQCRFVDARVSLHRACSLPQVTDRARVRILLESGRIKHASGEPGVGVAEFVAAFTLADRVGEEFLAVDAVHMLGIVTSLEDQVVWNKLAIKMAATSREPSVRRWLGTLYLNLGCTYLEGGRYADALRWFRAAEAWAGANASPMKRRKARLAIARCLRSCGAVDRNLAERPTFLLSSGAASYATASVRRSAIRR